MKKEEILEKLKSAGLNVASGSENPAVTYNSAPHYRGNYGFNTVTSDGFTGITVKGVYKDFLRVINGACHLSDNDWNETVKALNTAESTIKSPLEISFFVDSGICFIQSAEICEKPFFDHGKDIRDYMIPRPLTGVEYVLPSSKLYDESVMVSGGFFAEYFPRVLSPFAESVFSKIPDILNPLFVSCNLKTSSPSTLSVYNNLYINMTLYEKILKAIGLGNTSFRLKYAPQLYLKQQDKHKMGSLNKSYFPVEDVEIEDIIAEMERTVVNINAASLIEESFFEYPVQFTIAYEYLDIQFQNALSILLKTFPSVSDALTAVFKTRENSIFYSGEKKVARYLDFISDSVTVNFNLENNHEPIAKYVDGLPFFKWFKHGGQIKKTIKHLHKLLDIRDKLYLALSEYIFKSRTALLQIGDIAVSKGKADIKEDIFYFEYEDAKRVYNDSFFGDAAQSVTFRRSQLWRYAAQAIPPEIYGADFEKSAQISEKMIVKALELAEFEPLVLHKGVAEGSVTKDLTKTDYKNVIIAAKSLYPADLLRYETAAGFILENASPFGFASEYAILKDIPLYTGIRFAPLVLDGAKVKIDGNKISKI